MSAMGLGGGISGVNGERKGEAAKYELMKRPVTYPLHHVDH